MASNTDRANHHKRQCSRRLALQALYQRQFNEIEPTELYKQFADDEFWPKSDHAYFHQLVTGSIEHTKTLDHYISDASDYPVDTIDPIELAALRIAVYELIFCLHIPDKVLVSEAIQLCKKFGSDDGYKLVNAVLDKLIKTIDRLQISHQH